jgi:hypothetical protein
MSRLGPPERQLKKTNRFAAQRLSDSGKIPHIHGVQGVAGSNPVIPIYEINNQRLAAAQAAVCHFG